MNPFRSLLAVCLLGAASLHAQLIVTQSAAPVAPFTAMKANAGFVSGTLLNLGSVTSFSFGSLTFNLIPNLDPNAPSDLQVGGGFSADALYLASNTTNFDNFGVEKAITGVEDTAIYVGYGAGSSLSTHIGAVSPTDLVFWASDTTTTSVTKFDMGDPFHFRTFAASDLNNQYYIFAIDDRTSPVVDFNDGVFGVALNLRPAAFDSEPVPEPSTYALFGSAALLLLIAAKRFKRRSA